MTFREYLTTRQVRDNIQGDFTKYARNDAKLPDVTTWPELKHHLLLRNPRRGTVEAAQLVWQAYRVKLRQAESA